MYLVTKPHLLQLSLLSDFILLWFATQNTFSYTSKASVTMACDVTILAAAMVKTEAALKILLPLSVNLLALFPYGRS